MSAALDGIRVLDLTHVQAGPSATQMLGWLGADVVKIENPGDGDVTRQQLCDIPGAESLYFMLLNCNKRSITLNLKTAEGIDLMRRLMRDADVFVENFGPGAMERLGLGWEEVKQANSRLIFASVKGFSQGPYSSYKAYEPIAQAMGGAMSTTGFESGPPTVSGAQIGDSGAGIHLVAAILAALYQRTRTGRGQRVEVAMQHAVLNLCRVKLRDQQRLDRGPLPEYPGQHAVDVVPRSGNASGGGHPGAALRCAPGGPNDYIYLILQPRIWPALAETIGRPELADDPGWSTAEARLPKLGKIFEIIEEWTCRYSKWEVCEKVAHRGIPCAPVLSTKDILHDKALADNGTIVWLSDPVRGRFATVGCPLTLSESPVSISLPPSLGQHNDDIFGNELGIGESALEELRRARIV